jgi:hypothetical protein
LLAAAAGGCLEAGVGRDHLQIVMHVDVRHVRPKIPQDGLFFSLACGISRRNLRPTQNVMVSRVLKFPSCGS